MQRFSAPAAASRSAAPAVGEVQLPAVEAADVALGAVGAERRIDLPQPRERDVDVNRLLVADVDPDRHSHHVTDIAYTHTLGAVTASPLWASWEFAEPVARLRNLAATALPAPRNSAHDALVSTSNRREPPMSAPTPIDEPGDFRPRNHPRARVAKTVGALAAVGVLAFGAATVANNGSSAASSATPSTQAAPNGAPGGTPPQLGTEVSGATLTNLKSVVSAQYPGTVERALKLSDGSYVVHVIQTSGSEVHVLVSQALKITGTEQGPAGGALPAGQAAPSGSQS